MLLNLFLSLFVSIAFAQTPQNGPISLVDAPPQLIEVARCESGLTQFTDSGTVLKSYTDDYGIFQINKSWIPTAKKLGYDIMTPEGNVGFALYLYHQNGLKDWSASKHCWNQP